MAPDRGVDNVLVILGCSCNMPMEIKLKELRTDPGVTMFLLPLPKNAAREPDKTSAASASTKPSTLAATPLRPSKEARPAAKAKSMCPQE